ncbi:MAG: conjugal transfer protein [Mycobacteriaceae bacterium]|nr:conjugal transfer protein [Mycobacteriaceae bacterium]MBV9640825.1 conjugal transfer protein [Mycobacteriaceae bacterium]
MLTQTWRLRLLRTRSALKASAVAVALISCSVVAIATIGHWLFGAPIDVAGPARSAVNRAALVGSFAENCVGRWLTATQATRGALQECWTLRDPLTLPTTPAAVIGAPAVAAATLVGEGGDRQEWSVAVAVSQRPYDSAPPVAAYYRLPVVYSDYGVRAAAPPARISGPGGGADAALAYPVTVATASPVFAAVAGFLTAYLTSAGGLDRYATADSGLIAPPGPYQRAVIARLVSHNNVGTPIPAEGATLRVLVTVNAVTTQYAPTQLSYPLTLRVGAGRWSVASIDEAPLLDPAADLVPVALQ